MEYWDIYDRDKKLTGRTMKKNDWNMKDGEFHLTVLGVLKRPDKKFLITQRVMTKSWAPGHWEVSGGGVKAGETSREAVNREVLEETGIDVSGIKEDFLYTYSRENPKEGDNYFVDAYLFTVDFELNDVKIQEEEVMDYKLATLEEIKKIAEEGKFMHYDSIKCVFEK
jgi:8-oxo-dGTP diphosphatase